MPTTAYTAFYDEVLPELNGAVANAMVLNAIKQAAIEFCNRTLVWRVDQGPMPVSPGANEYDWEPPTGTEIVRATQVWLEKRSLVAKTANQLSEMYGDYMQAEGSPQFFVQDKPAMLIVVPKPNSHSSVGLTAKVAVKPTQAASGLETWIADRYRDAIAHGAKSRLFRMPRKPWSSAQLAADYWNLFEKAVGETQVEVSRGFAGARARVRPMFF